MILDRNKVEVAMVNAGILSINELSKKMGCTKQNVSQLFYRSSCNTKTAKKLADALNVPVEQISMRTTLEQISTDDILNELKRRLEMKSERHENA